MEKFCVFCGEQPVSKNREHVIPDWLIRLTGDPSRSVNLGRDWMSPDSAVRRYALSAYTFPACGECNTRFSALEAKTQSIVESILAREAVSADEWSTFLDWLDKVRIGLWLGGLYLNKNPLGITPHFHIEKRLGLADRFVVVYETERDGFTGVGWAGTDSPLFGSMPSCFVLSIKDFVFFSASTLFLFSERFGFPYLAGTEVSQDGSGYSVTLAEGTMRHRLPLVKWNFPTGGTHLWQPMVPCRVLADLGREWDGTADFYDSDFVRDSCMDFAAGTGKVFMHEGGRLVPYPAEASREWIPSRVLPKKPTWYRTHLAAGKYLEKLANDSPLMGLVREREQPAARTQREVVLAVHRALVSNLVQHRELYF